MARQKTGCRNRGTLGASPAPLYDRVEDLRPAAERPAPAAPAPQKTAKVQTKRRRKAIMALRALHRKIGD